MHDPPDEVGFGDGVDDARAAEIDRLKNEGIPVETPEAIRERSEAGPVQLPTVGRSVHYHPGHGEPLKPLNEGEPLMATVAAVHGNGGIVNLMVVSAFGEPAGRTSVPFVQPGETAAPGQSFACWMPYQAKKHQGAVS